MFWKKFLVVVIIAVVVLVSTVWVILANYDYKKLKPEIENAFKGATGRELILRGNLDLKIGLTPTLLVRDAALQNAPWGSRPEMAKIESLEVRLALIPLIFHHIDVKRIVLVNPDILIETNPKGVSNLDFLQKTGTQGTKQEGSGEQKTRLTAHEVNIRNGRITFRNGKTGKTHVITVERFSASARTVSSPLKVTLNGSYNDKPFEVKGNLIAPAGLTDTTRSWPFDLTFGAAGTTFGLEGTIKDVTGFQGADVRVVVKSKDVGLVGRFVDKPLPIQGPLEMSCRLTDPEPNVYQISDLKVATSGSDLDGSLRIDLAKPRPFFSADLSSKILDLRPLVKKKSPSTGQSGQGKIFSSSPLPFNLLQTADATLSFKAAEVFSPRLALRNFATALSLKDGSLSVRPLTAVIGGGSLDGWFTMEPWGKSARLRMFATISRLDLGSMLRELKEKDIAEGPLDARIDVNGTGNSVAALMSDLNGMTYMIMGKGRINNRYVGLLGSNVGSQVFHMINPFSKEAPFTSVSCIVCGFKIRNGFADTTALLVNGEYMSVVGNGTINLRTEALDFSLRPVPKEGIETGIAGKLNLSMGELTRPLKLTGTLGHPSLSIDFKETAIEAGKAVGGFMLLGPVGLGGALVSESSSGEQSCPLAVKAAQQGVKLSLIEKKEGEGLLGKATQGVKKGLGKMGKSLKKLFGK